MTFWRLGIWLGLLLLAAPALRADEPSFTAEQRAALQMVIDQAVARAMSSSEGNDPGATTRIPDGTIPGFSAEQSAELSKLIDTAVKSARASAGQPAANVADAAKRPAAKPVSDDIPVTDARMLTWDNSSVGAAQEAIALTDTGLNNASTAPNTSSVQVITGNANARVSLKIDLSSATADLNGDGVVTASSLVLSAPVDKNDDQGTDIFGLEGLSNNFQADFNFSRIHTQALGHPGQGADALSPLFNIQDACESIGLKLSKCNYSSLLRTASNKPADTVSSPRVLKLSSGNPVMTAEEILERFDSPGRAWVQGFRLKTGYDQFSFIDPASAAKQKQNEVPWSAGVYFGRLSGSSYYAAGVDYQRQYKAANSGTVCPLAAGPVLRCSTGALGSPSAIKENLIWAEGRWLIKGRGVSVKLTRELEEGEWDLSVPIYLFPDAKGVLTGGVRLGWSDADKFNAGIFVGLPFALWQ